jgi:hypothetical protein
MDQYGRPVQAAPYPPGSAAVPQLGYPPDDPAVAIQHHQAIQVPAPNDDIPAQPLHYNNFDNPAPSRPKVIKNPYVHK